MIFFLSLILSWSFWQAHAQLKTVQSCAPSKGSQKVLLVKQWHLSPRTITKGFRERYPQEKNQTAIYSALSKMVREKKVDLVVAEGCEGEINAEFKTSFNGWDYAALKKQSRQKGYDRILTHVPLKLAARFGHQLKTVCGDSERWIQEGNLRLSNLRGWSGFWHRLKTPNQDEETQKRYAEAAAELLKISKDSSVEKILKEITTRLRQEIETFRNSLKERNSQFIATLQKQSFKTAAIVIGGLHSDDLKSKLEGAKFNCEVLKPPGYNREDERLIEDFEKIVSSNGN